MRWSLWCAGLALWALGWFGPGCAKSVSSEQVVEAGQEGAREGAAQEQSQEAAPDATTEGATSEGLHDEVAQDADAGDAQEAGGSDSAPDEAGGPDSAPDEAGTSPDDVDAVHLGLTYTRADGNRWISGKGALSGAQPLDITLAGKPVWLVAARHSKGSVWVVALEDGRLQGFVLQGRQASPLTLQPNRLPAGMPPAIRIEQDKVRLLVGPPSASTQTHPSFLARRNELAFIDNKGDLVVGNGQQESGRFAIQALPDARILVDEQERLLVLAGATKRYAHAVLGDELEASTIVLLETSPRPKILQTIQIPAPHVVEGIMPIWTSLLHVGGKREILVTLSDAQGGGQVVLLNEGGSRLAQGPQIGTGYRWRHQLAVAPLGPGGAVEFVEVLTPHIGGPLGFFALRGRSLMEQTAARGYTSHVIASRNLDMAIVGDFDGDGQPEVVIPNQARTQLGGIQHISTGAKVVWQKTLDGTLSTNLAAATLSDGSLILGAGVQGSRLRLWPSP